MSLLQERADVLLELPLWLSDMCFMPGREQMGYDKRANLDLP